MFFSLFIFFRKLSAFCGTLWHLKKNVREKRKIMENMENCLYSSGKLLQLCWKIVTTLQHCNKFLDARRSQGHL